MKSGAITAILAAVGGFAFSAAAAPPSGQYAEQRESACNVSQIEPMDYRGAAFFQCEQWPGDWYAVKPFELNEFQIGTTWSVIMESYHLTVLGNALGNAALKKAGAVCFVTTNVMSDIYGQPQRLVAYPVIADPQLGYCS